MYRVLTQYANVGVIMNKIIRTSREILTQLRNAKSGRLRHNRVDKHHAEYGGLRGAKRDLVKRSKDGEARVWERYVSDGTAFVNSITGVIMKPMRGVASERASRKQQPRPFYNVIIVSGRVARARSHLAALMRGSAAVIDVSNCR